LALGPDTVYVVRMEGSRKEAPIVHFADSESSEIQSYAVCVQYFAIGREDRDVLPNSIDHRAKVRLTLPQLLQ
jgi:hypothetical protein